MRLREAEGLSFSAILTRASRESACIFPLRVLVILTVASLVPNARDLLVEETPGDQPHHLLFAGQRFEMRPQFHIQHSATIIEMKSLSTAQRVALIFAAVGFIAAGVLHFISTPSYLKIMPPYIPYHLTLVYVSGVFEMLGGLGLLVPQTRRTAAWGLIALLIAVFPANIYMATNPVESGAASLAPVLRWCRLPLQPLLAWWLLWCTKPSSG